MRICFLKSFSYSEEFISSVQVELFCLFPFGNNQASLLLRSLTHNLVTILDDAMVVDTFSNYTNKLQFLNYLNCKPSILADELQVHTCRL